MTQPDLSAAASAVELARAVVHDGIVALAAAGPIDDNQVLAYDVAHASAAVETARTLLDYGAKGDVEARITCAFVADKEREKFVDPLGPSVMSATWPRGRFTLPSTALRKTSVLVSSDKTVPR